MSHIDDHIRSMRDASQGRSQRGFSVIELLVATTVMLVVIAAIFSLMGSSIKVATAAYEMTDAQQNLRTAHEFINRDLMNAGDGLKSIDEIRIPEPFMRSYITLAPVPACAAAICTLSIFTPTTMSRHSPQLLELCRQRTSGPSLIDKRFWRLTRSLMSVALVNGGGISSSTCSPACETASINATGTPSQFQ